ncbi:LuxR family transcriptional regulator [Caballeronia fortuita]|uniref:LuxR family transcriptional regulator n=1 Tax=Caballeronia fortuita TaxID=1777138 RepID=A0A158CBY0_9BURK|nr:helix-turn-helix transcriptional regulator [Caballeronia fortuita]SAK79416.1 LuxR family transcriptional regulator [Caballeronia fortuita]
MNLSVSDITLDEMRLFGDIVALLEELGPIVDVRGVVLPSITKLLRADYCASFEYDQRSGLWVNGISYNVDKTHVSHYETWFQHNDPMTDTLRKRGAATFVEEVISRHDLDHSEFYNDFLRRDGLHHGINVHSFDGGKHIGDLRIWRAQSRPEFTDRDKVLLDGIEPFLRRALTRRRCSSADLTERENDVAQLVATGCTDKEISRILNIEASTVRTHLRRVMTKKGVTNRSKLAAALV